MRASAQEMIDAIGAGEYPPVHTARSSRQDGQRPGSPKAKRPMTARWREWISYVEGITGDIPKLNLIA